MAVILPTRFLPSYQLLPYIDRFAVPLDAVDADGEECSLMDFIPSDSDTFEEAVYIFLYDFSHDFLTKDDWRDVVVRQNGKNQFVA